jgi:hypothetical protein
MTCWYELRGTDNRLVELRRGFASEVEAWQAAGRALAKIKAIAPLTETLRIVTGVDADKRRNSSPKTKPSRIITTCAQMS